MSSSLHEGISPTSESYQMVLEILASLVFVCLFVFCKNSQGEFPYSSEKELTEVFCIRWKVNRFVGKSIYLDPEFGGPFCCLTMLPVPFMWLHLLLSWIIVNS